MQNQLIQFKNEHVVYCCVVTNDTTTRAVFDDGPHSAILSIELIASSGIIFTKTESVSAPL